MFSRKSVLVFILAVASLITAQNASVAYTPTVGDCPSGFSLVRDASNSSEQILSESERNYISNRKSKVIPKAWKSYLANVKKTKARLPPYVSDILGCDDPSSQPTLGIATSGGGYRAGIFGGGVLNALDGCNSTSAKIGTGGLLQAATYLSGLSGSAWLVTSLAQTGFPTINDLIFGSNTLSGWLAQLDLLAPSNESQVDMAYAVGLVLETKGKLDAGFLTGIGDVWGRALSRHFLTGTTSANFLDLTVLHGAGVTFSSIADL
jgi:lysophospholipase